MAIKVPERHLPGQATKCGVPLTVLSAPHAVPKKMAISFLGLLGLMLPLDNFLCHHSESFFCIAVWQNVKRFARFCSICLSQFPGSLNAFRLGNNATSLSSKINQTPFGSASRKPGLMNGA